MESLSMVNPRNLHFDHLLLAPAVGDSVADGLWTTFGKRHSDPVVRPPRTIDDALSPSESNPKLWACNPLPLIHSPQLLSLYLVSHPGHMAPACPTLQALSLPVGAGLGVRAPGS